MGRLSRRALLSAAPLGAAACVSVRGRAAIAEGEAAFARTPRERLLGFMRLFAGVTGSCVFTNEGIIYGRAPDDLVTPLIGFLAVLEIRPEQVGDGVFRTRQKEAMVYLDLETGLPAPGWRNPMTGRDLTPIGYVSPENVYYFDDHGSYIRAIPSGARPRGYRDFRR